MKIIAPNKNYNGTSASVPFINGVGETNNPHLINWFRENGYKVEENVSENATPENSVEPNFVPELDKMSAEELTAFAQANNIDIGKATAKDTILKKIKEAGAKNGDSEE